MPTLFPRALSAARFTVTVDLPTPPFALTSINTKPAMSGARGNGFFTLPLPNAHNDTA